MQYPIRPHGTICFLILALLCSCESDPDIMNDSAPKTLFVWGNVDLYSGLHQVRIREAIQEEGNMYELTQDPVLSLPKDPLLVNLIIQTSTHDIELEMNPVIYPKDEGIFSAENNIIHEVEYDIPKGVTCKLLIKNLKTGESLHSSIVAPPAIEFNYPVHFGWFVPKYHFNNFQEPFHVTFKVKSDLVQKLVTEIKYVDMMLNGDTICQKAIFEGQPIYGGGSFEQYNKTFPLDYVFNILKQKIPVDPNVKFRWFHRFNFKSQSASEGLRDYLRLGDRFNDNRKLNFTNIDGGYGLFYAWDQAETGDIEPTSSFPDTLSRAPETLDLKFSRYIFPGTYIDPDDE